MPKHIVKYKIDRLVKSRYASVLYLRNAKMPLKAGDMFATANISYMISISTNC